MLQKSAARGVQAVELQNCTRVRRRKDQEDVTTVALEVDLGFRSWVIHLRWVQYEFGKAKETSTNESISTCDPNFLGPTETVFGESQPC